MVGARLRVELTGIDETEKRLRALAEAGRDLTPAMQDMGEYLLRTTKDRFADETDPAGAPWQPLSEATKARKKRNRGRILTQDGFLGGQLAYQAGATDLELGSGLVYAGTQQFGAEEGAFGTTAAGRPIPWGDIPAREFLGLSDADRDEIGDILRDFLAEQL